MTFAGINYLAIVLAATASFLFGGVWYGALSKRWIEATGKTEDELVSDGRPMVLLFGITIAAQLIMATVLAGILGHLGAGQVTIGNGLVSALFIWTGFVITTLVVNHGYQGQRWSLTMIDGAHWLGVLLIQGLIIGWMGVS